MLTLPIKIMHEGKVIEGHGDFVDVMIGEIVDGKCKCTAIIDIHMPEGGPVKSGRREVNMEAEDVPSEEALTEFLMEHIGIS